MSLREQKRSLRQRTILLAAADVFKANGIDASKMEDIAAVAEVSPGTVYNYFPTKDALVRALTHLYRLDISEQRENILENPQLTPLEAFSELYRVWIDGAERYLSREVWRYGQMVGLISSSPEARQHEWLNELELIDAQQRLLNYHIALGHLPKTLDSAAWAKLLHAAGFFWWMYYLCNDEVTSAVAKQRIEEQFKLIFSAVN